MKTDRFNILSNQLDENESYAPYSNDNILETKMELPSDCHDLFLISFKRQMQRRENCGDYILKTVELDVYSTWFPICQGPIKVKRKR